MNSLFYDDLLQPVMRSYNWWELSLVMFAHPYVISVLEVTTEIPKPVFSTKTHTMTHHCIYFF
jgi:hypothetical protein